MEHFLVPILVVLVGALSYFLYRLVQANEEKKKNGKGNVLLWGTLSGVSGALLLLTIGGLFAKQKKGTPREYMSPYSERPSPSTSSPYLTARSSVRSSPKYEGSISTGIPVQDAFILSDGTPIRLNTSPKSVARTSDFEDVYLSPPTSIRPSPKAPVKKSSNPLFETLNKIKDSALDFIAGGDDDFDFDLD